jgi:hypothetical protein
MNQLVIVGRKQKRTKKISIRLGNLQKQENNTRENKAKKQRRRKRHKRIIISKRVKRYSSSHMGIKHDEHDKVFVQL